MFKNKIEPKIIKLESEVYCLKLALSYEDRILSFGGTIPESKKINYLTERLLCLEDYLRIRFNHANTNPASYSKIKK